MSGNVLEVSVIVPTHARRALLERLLVSLERQTLPAGSFEVLIVHNHTDDGTEEMAQAWCARQPFRARYFRKAFNGPTRSRDFGARTSIGRIIAFVDDDCVVDPGWLSAGIAAFDRGADAATPASVGLAQGRTVPMPGQPFRFPTKTIHIERPTVFYETCNIFYSREAFEAVGGFSDDFLDRFYGEDTDLGWKVRQHGYDAAFASAALAFHEVFHVSFYRWLAEPLHFHNLPYLVRKYPALRASMFHRYFLSADTCLFHLFLAALLALPFSTPLGAILAAPYLIERFRNGRHVGGVVPRLARIVVGLPRNLFMWWALVRGSLHARSVLL